MRRDQVQHGRAVRVRIPALPPVQPLAVEMRTKLSEDVGALAVQIARLQNDLANTPFEWVNKADALHTAEQMLTDAQWLSIMLAEGAGE